MFISKQNKLKGLHKEISKIIPANNVVGNDGITRTRKLNGYIFKKLKVKPSAVNSDSKIFDVLEINMSRKMITEKNNIYTIKKNIKGI